ncbi:MAG TPA: bifunctional 4-hydroxy-2-oxoglutarate aldolase/2-dehydro-3-deoxy-phosphogluconate aldolase [Actinopolymorphaceae bacterium]
MSLDTVLSDMPVIAILRASTAERFGEVTDVLVDAGIHAVEFTMTTPKVLDAIRSYAARKPENVALGAGTVLTADDARKAVDAGATYLISPTVEIEVIEEGARLGVPVIPGAFTPTEILTAWRAGAHMVKVFPSIVGGTAFLKAIRGPLPDIPLVPTGGVEISNARAFLEAGANAVGVGSPLVGNATEPRGSLPALKARATELVGSVRRRDT